MAGWFGGCGIFLKTAIDYVKDGAWSGPYLYIFAACALVTITAGVVVFAIALKKYSIA